jgi:lipoprotein-releasing system ATP-binding protein
MSAPIVRLKEVSREYGDVVITRALDQVDLSLERHEFTALLGPSGSGKSTLLNIMGLLDRPTEGKVLINGEDTTDLDDDGITGIRGRTLGFVFQFHHLLTGFTALENVMMPAAVDKGMFTDAIRKRAANLLDEVGLEGEKDKDVRHLSGGQKQRVAIARALTNEPDLVLADEPTGNLDTKAADVVMDLMRRINEETGTAFLIVTHDEERAQTCKRLLRLVDGKLVEDHNLESGE